MRTALISLVTIALLADHAAAQNTDRNAFDFLVGSWTLEERLDRVRNTSERGDDKYVFRQPIRGGAIEASWRFNRRTAGNPDYTNAIYVSGYHDPTRSWSFYYVSERSAQHWKGRRSGDRWYFYFDEPFEYEGRQAVQRQWWEPVGRDRLHRHFENSYDGGQTWTLVITAVLRREG